MGNEEDTTKEFCMHCLVNRSSLEHLKSYSSSILQCLGIMDEALENVKNDCSHCEHIATKALDDVKERMNTRWPK